MVDASKIETVEKSLYYGNISLEIMIVFPRYILFCDISSIVIRMKISRLLRLKIRLADFICCIYTVWHWTLINKLVWYPILHPGETLRHSDSKIKSRKFEQSNWWKSSNPMKGIWSRYTLKSNFRSTFEAALPILIWPATAPSLQKSWVHILNPVWFTGSGCNLVKNWRW